MPRALITGIGGQDGSYLAELLLERGYEVFGTTRRPAKEYESLAHLSGRVTLAAHDSAPDLRLDGLLEAWRPTEIYNLAAASFVPDSWGSAHETARLSALSAVKLFESARVVTPEARIYQASSSEIFGIPELAPQNEGTPLNPITPYGAAKAYAHFMAQIYRRQYGMFICCGIAYNHESPRRPERFLPQKVARGVARIFLGQEDELVLGNLLASRDWGYAPDYVRAMKMMLNHTQPDDYVIASGQMHSVAELCKEAFSYVGMDWRDHVRTDEELQRGADELGGLVGEADHARDVLGWGPTLGFRELIAALVEAQLARVRSELAEIRASGRVTL